MEYADKKNLPYFNVCHSPFLLRKFMLEKEIMSPNKMFKKYAEKSACVKCQFGIRAKSNVVNGHFQKRKM